MKSVYQDKFPLEGQLGNGNCLSACIASIFELPIDEVPHFTAAGNKDWFTDLNFYLQRFGSYSLLLPYLTTKVLLQGHYIVIGNAVYYDKKTKKYNKSMHAVVGFGGEIVFDPFNAKHPGYFEPLWICLIVRKYD